MLIITLGNTELSVNAMGLGAMPLSLAGRPDEKTAHDLIKTFVEAGGNFIDTANVYCPGENDVGHNEKLIIKSLKQLGAVGDVKIATKGGLRRLTDNWSVDASPKWLRASCENSLIDLNTHSIFLYQLHAPDSDVPLLDSVGELMRLREEGLIQHIGLSNVSYKQIVQILEQTEIMSVQNCCNVFQKEDVSKGVVRFCSDQKITFICHSPVGGHYKHKEFMSNRILNEIAEQHETTAYVISLAWLLHQGKNVLPIPGGTKTSSVKDSMKAHDIKLGKEEAALLHDL